MKYMVVLSRQVYETAVTWVEADSEEEAADVAQAGADEAHFSAPPSKPPFRDGVAVEYVVKGDQ